MKGTVTIVGAGPGVGAAVARRFGTEGHPVALVARNRDRLDGMVAELEEDGTQAAAASADVRRPAEVRHALADLAARVGPAEILCFSPLADVSLIKPVLDTTADDLAAALELQVVGAARPSPKSCQTCASAAEAPCFSPRAARRSRRVQSEQPPESPTAPRTSTYRCCTKRSPPKEST